jgi:phasin family protein
MYASLNPFAELHQAGMEALIEFAHAQFTALERLSALNFNVARSAFKDSTAYAKALLVTKDTPEISRLSAALVLPALDRTIVYSLGVCELGSQAQGEMARLVDAQATEFNASIATGLDTLAKYAPAGSGMALKAVKSALDTANSALDSLTEFGVKTSELAQTKFAAVTSGIADADTKSSKRSGTTSKTNRDSKDSKGSSQARKGTNRKAA